MKKQISNENTPEQELSLLQPQEHFETIGIILKTLRVSHGYKQRAVARAIKVTTSAYSHYECSERFPDLTTLIKISNLYQINISYLILVTCIDLARKNDISVNDVFRAYSYNQTLPKDDADILIEYNHLSPENKENLHLFLNAALNC